VKIVRSLNETKELENDENEESDITECREELKEYTTRIAVEQLVLDVHRPAIALFGLLD
jgi:hypothetical protein